MLALVTTEHGIILFKILLAWILGGIIGLERELKRKPVGLKTCTIISITSCVLTIVSVQSALHYAGVSPNISTDPMRLAAQVISGVGFLGAGVILHRHDDMISGLTTAAIVWAASGLGIVVGAGFYFDAITATIIILIAIKVSPRFVPKKRQSRIYFSKLNLLLQVTNTQAVTLVINKLTEENYLIDNITIKDDNDRVDVNMKILLNRKITIYELYDSLKSDENILSLQVESA